MAYMQSGILMGHWPKKCLSKSPATPCYQDSCPAESGVQLLQHKAAASKHMGDIHHSAFSFGPCTVLFVQTLS